MCARGDRSGLFVVIGIPVRVCHGNTQLTFIVAVSVEINVVVRLGIGGAGKQYMIPAIKEFIRLIDVDAGVVRVHLIEGFATDEN